MSEQIRLFQAPCVVASRDRERDPDWPHTTWRWGPGREIEHRHPSPTSSAPPPVLGGDWVWNPLVPGWRVEYPRPPFPLDPSGEKLDRFGPKLIPPAGFREVHRRRLCGRCPCCREPAGGRWGGPGWHGWSDPRIAAAFEAEEAAGRRCYGLSEIDVEGLGRVNPLTHYSRWGAGYCAACGAISWNDFRELASAYYRSPSR